MLREPLVDDVVRMLENEGYVTCTYHGCFDIAAKKNKLLLIKVLQNIDSFSPEQSKNIRIIAANLGATALLVGVQTRREKLKPGIVYERFELPAVSVETLRLMIEEGIFPKIYRDKGGLYVRIDRELLREARKGSGLTQRELAEAVGINKKAIYEHERESLRMVLSIAEKIEGMLGKKMTKDIDMIKNVISSEGGKPADILEKQVGADLKKLGFTVSYVKQAPFDVFAKEKALIVSDIESNARKLRKRAVSLGEFTKITDKPALLITEKIKLKDVDVPVIERSELGGMSSKEVIKLARKRK